MSMDTTPHQSLRPGIAVGPIRLANIGWNGTIGAIVRLGGQKMILSCYHVLVADNKFKEGDAIGQPSTSQNLVTHLYRERIIDATRDAALSVIDNPNIQTSNDILGLPIQLRGFATSADIDQIINSRTRVTKRGISTNVTSGKIVNKRQSRNVRYPALGREFTLHHLLQIQKDPPNGPFSLEGDSGACIVTDGGIIVALLVAGDNNFSYATPIHEILDFFDGLSL